MSDLFKVISSNGVTMKRRQAAGKNTLVRFEGNIYGLNDSGQFVLKHGCMDIVTLVNEEGDSFDFVDADFHGRTSLSASGIHVNEHYDIRASKIKRVSLQIGRKYSERRNKVFLTRGKSFAVIADGNEFEMLDKESNTYCIEERNFPPMPLKPPQSARVMRVGSDLWSYTEYPVTPRARFKFSGPTFGGEHPVSFLPGPLENAGICIDASMLPGGRIYIPQADVSMSFNYYKHVDEEVNRLISHFKKELREWEEKVTEMIVASDKGFHSRVV